ncbi:putative RNA-directed DNA polymerase [Tanacetum coccineum]
MVGSNGSSEDKISSLDLGNLLQLQNSDFNSATIISVKLIRTENYKVWAAAMKLAIISTRNKTGFLDGTCLKSAYASSDSLSNQWDRYEGRATSNDEGSAPNSPNTPRSVSDGGTTTSIGDKSISEGNSHNTQSVLYFQDPIDVGLNVPITDVSFKNTYEVQPVVATRKSNRQTKLPAKFNDYVVNSSKKYGLEKVVNYSKLSSGNYCFSTSLNKSTEPSTFYEAIKDRNWIDAMNAEIEALNRNNTWTITTLPKGRKAIGSKWVYKIKYKATGNIDRYKARLVAKGFGQKEGIDFDETFSPVVKMTTVRCLINIVVQKDWPLYQLDVNNAFLYGDLYEDVYMTLPPGFSSNNDKVVCSGDNFVALLVYVDDIVITGSDIKQIDDFKQYLKSKFQIKDLGLLKYFLGIEVLRNDKGICLTQRKYCLEVLHEFGLLAAKPVLSPLPANFVLNHIESNEDKALTNVSNYQKLIGKLIYLTHTRPDISYFVHCLSQHMHSPLASHLKMALRVLRYLKGSPGSGVQVNKTENFGVKVYTDSDWARCLITRKSVSGFCVFLGDSLVSWKSKKQATLSRSLTEFEYRCMTSATCEIIWICNVLSEFGIKNVFPVEMFYDNISALQLAANLVFHEKSKHFEIELHLIREKVSKGVVKTFKVHTTQQIADIFNKCLDVKQHQELVDLQGCFMECVWELRGYSGSLKIGYINHSPAH